MQIHKVQMINLANMLKESLELAKNNITVVIPSVIVSIVMLIFIKVFIGEYGDTVEALSSGVREPQSRQGIFLLGFISSILQTFSQGIIISMVDDQIKGWICSLRNGLKVTVSKLTSLMLAAFIIGLMVYLGMILLLFPALIVSFIFMFTIVIIITEDIGAIEAMKKSCFVVKENLSQCMRFFLVVFGTGFLLGLISGLVVAIPVLGQIIVATLMGLYMSFMAIVMTKFYRKLNLKRTG